MATTNKNFKIKNGLDVALGASFGEPILIPEPTLYNHATTKQYVDDAIIAYTVPVYNAPPEFANNGQLFFDSVTGRMAVYYNSEWIVIATFGDTVNDLQQHIHDTAIGGTGLIVSIIEDAGYYNEAGTEEDAGYYNTNLWLQTWDGGIAVDNFN